MTNCPHCGNLLKGNNAQSEAPLPKANEQVSAASAQVHELDHRGIRLPARTRVGGIIIPQ
jgi:hypothetical protein